MAAATHKATELEKSTDELKKQLEDLLKAKKDDEHQLLEKFRDLLNEKKLKIRQQQRLLAAADVDPARLQNLSGGASEATRRKAKASRGGKRKTNQNESDSDNGFERMDIDHPVEVKDESEDKAGLNDRHTSDEEGAEEATASDAETTDNEPQPVVPSSTKGKRKAGTRNSKPSASSTARKPPASSRSSRARIRAAASPEDSQDEPAQQLPPKRILPFQTKKNEKTPEAVASADGNETASDDDEL